MVVLFAVEIHMTLFSRFAPHSQDVPVALIDALRQAHRLVIFSGAGMSAESGIPTFREAMHGLWAQFDPQELASPEGWDEDQARVWAWYEWRRGLVMRAEPHAGHVAIPQLAHALSCFTGHEVCVDVVTQNVDDLHERAGEADVQHLHGSLFAPRCTTCGKPGEFAGLPPLEPIERIVPPRCQYCPGFLRPGVVWFGESLPRGAWHQAENLIASCDVLLVVGTSGVVYPAASLPAAARQAGKWVAEINPTSSELSSHVNLHWQTTAAQGLGSLLHVLTTQGTA